MKTSHTWLVAIIIFAAHNLEEIVRNMPAWGGQHFAFLKPYEQWEAQFAVAVIMLVVGLALLAYKYRDNVALLRVFLVVMLLIGTWHIVISLATNSAQPGVFTAVPMVAAYAYLLVISRRAVPSV